MNTEVPEAALWPPPILGSLRKILAGISAVWSKEHNPDGTHANVTATSLAVAADTTDGAFLGNISTSLIPTTATQDLGEAWQAGGTLGRVRPWRRLYVSDTITWAAFSNDTTSALAGGDPDLAVDASGFLTWTLSGGTGTILTLTSATGNVTWSSGGVWHAPTLNGDTVVAGANGFFERSRVVAVGEWIDVTFASGNFTANGGGSWTLTSGDQNTFRYMLVGKTLIVEYYFVTTSVTTGPSTALSVTIPGGFTANKNTATRTAYCVDNGTLNTARAAVAASGTTIVFSRDDSGNWANAADSTEMFGQIIIEVQ